MGASNVGFVLALPFLLSWLLVARLLSMLSPIVAPWLSYILAQRLYYATPFALYALRAGGGAKAVMTRVGFEASYCMNGARWGRRGGPGPLVEDVRCGQGQHATFDIPPTA